MKKRWTEISRERNNEVEKMSNLKEMYVSENHLCESADNALDDGAACIVYPKYEVDVRIKSLEQQLEIALKALESCELHPNGYTNMTVKYAIDKISKLKGGADE